MAVLDDFPALLQKRLHDIAGHADFIKLPEAAKQKIEEKIIINTILREKVEAATSALIKQLLNRKNNSSKI